MRHLRSVLMAVALSAVLVVPVRGDLGSILNGTFTGGNNFSTTASFHLSYCINEFASCPGTTGVFYLTLNVTNLVGSGDGAVYKAIGLLNLPAGAVVGVGYADNSLGGWTMPPPNDLGGAGLPSNTWAWISPNPAPSQGLQPGQSGTFRFGLTNVTLAQVQALGVGVHGISGPNGCSTKMGAINGEVIDNEDSDAYARCGSTTVPEPSTVVLLGTGLVGLLGVAYRRRRDEDIE